MALWQIALVFFGVAWAFQAAGVWFQTRHYQQTFSELRGRWADGALGAGAAASRFGKGVIALLVVGPSGEVRAARAMVGRTVFAKFAELRELEGISLDELKARVAAPDFDASRRIAFTKATEQVEKVRAERAGKSERIVSQESQIEQDRANDATIISRGALC